MKKTLIPLLLLVGLAAIALHRRQSAEPQMAVATEAVAGNVAPSSPSDAGRQTVEDSAVCGLEIPQYESPRGSQILHRTGYTAAYDADFKTPQWVGWQLTAARAQGTVPRYDKFTADPDVRGAKAYPSDYKNSGFDRGHIAPAGDMKWDEKAMRESFYLSNVCPQNQNLNRGDWKDLEELERTWAINYGAVSITAGPIYETKRPMRIGANKVAVPDGFFKVLLVGYPDAPRAYGFVFKNVADSHSLSYYQLTVDEVEARTGMDFFSALPDDVEARIEAERPDL